MIMRTRFHCWLICGLISVLFLACPSTGKAQDERPVLAFYYAWYDEKSWTADQVPDMPLSPYRSADRATIERHVHEAQSAGIDAFVQSWYGPVDNPTERNFKTLLEVAQTTGFKATVDLEVGSPFIHNVDDLKKALRHVITVHAAHPAFFRYDGRPVIFFWQNRQLARDTWQAIRAEVDPQRQTIWIAEGDDPRWLDVFDGLHLYTITWVVNTNPQYTASKMRQRVDAYNTANNTHRYWVATTMPGYDDTHIAGRANAFVYPRSSAYYRQTWEAAMASTPEMIVITSFNEWREGTMIEPSVTYGRIYLDLTGELAAVYKGHVSASTSTPLPTTTSTVMPVPTATPATTPTATPTMTPTATPTMTPTATPTMTPTATRTSTFTPLPPTATLIPEPTPSPTWTASVTPALTATYTLVATSSPAPTRVDVASPSAGPDTAWPICASAVGMMLALLGWFVFRRKF